VARFWGRVARCDFDYFSRVDIVSGADARGWTTNHYAELSSLRCYCCTGGSALNNEMKKDKRMRAVVGKATGRRNLLTVTSLMYINKQVTMIITEKPKFERCSR
jgi:hypothetical protein